MRESPELGMKTRRKSTKRLKSNVQMSMNDELVHSLFDLISNLGSE